MTASVELKFNGQMDHLRLAWQAGDTVLASVPFEEAPEDTRYNILLSIQELLTNVLRHGGQETEGADIVLRLEASATDFAFEIHDRGPRFDPTSHLEETVTGGEMPEEAGGYGLVIVRMVMDGFDYRWQDGWNVVRATKSVRSSELMDAAGVSDVASVTGELG